jgi:hypothetical protein
MRTYEKLLIAMAALGLAAAGHAAATTIADLLALPNVYDGQTVTVTGTVDETIPAGSESGYNFRDGTTKVTVVSRKSAPATGSRLAVTGVVHAVRGGDEPEDLQFPPFLVETSRAPAP